MGAAVSAPTPVRIGIVGAGNFTRRRLIPGFRAIPGVELVAVANRSLASSQAVAAETGIPDTLADWKDLLARDDIDIVLIGTPPYFHCEAAIAALDAGKHVMTVTRMAANFHEAWEMTRKAEETDRVAAVFNTVSSTPINRYVKHLIDSGYVGQLRQAFAVGFIADYADSAAPLSRRQDARLFGSSNALSLGSSWDTMRYWFGDAGRLVASARNFTPERSESPGGPPIKVGIPDAITVIAELPSGATVTCIQSGVARFGEDRIEIFGEAGTLIYRDRQLFGATRADSALQPLPIPAEFQDLSGPETEFVAAIRGELPRPSYTFRDGMKNMEFLEAAQTSAQMDRWALPSIERSSTTPSSA